MAERMAAAANVVHKQAAERQLDGGFQIEKLPAASGRILEQVEAQEMASEEEQRVRAYLKLLLHINIEICFKFVMIFCFLNIISTGILCLFELRIC